MAVLVVAALGLIPVLGGLIKFALVLLGLGGLTLAGWQHRDKRA